MTTDLFVPCLEFQYRRNEPISITIVLEHCRNWTYNRL